MSVIPAQRRLKQEDHELEASLGNRGRLRLKKKKNPTKDKIQDRGESTLHRPLLLFCVVTQFHLNTGDHSTLSFVKTCRVEQVQMLHWVHLS
jgi:hypothetical protein